LRRACQPAAPGSSEALTIFAITCIKTAAVFVVIGLYYAFGIV
jgi:hypothetical protein